MLFHQEQCAALAFSSSGTPGLVSAHHWTRLRPKKNAAGSERPPPARRMGSRHWCADSSQSWWHNYYDPVVVTLPESGVNFICEVAFMAQDVVIETRKLTKVYRDFWGRRKK